MSITFETTVAGLAETVNFSNSNAAAMLSLLGLDAQPWGEVQASEVATLVRSMLRSLNVASAREAALVEPTFDGRLFEGGRDDASVRRRVAALITLFQAAQRNGCGVYWG